tara:strand:+ start:130 stop:1407 length:1278 start_codon:yes stop_codon:yes gene_type:complete
MEKIKRKIHVIGLNSFKIEDLSLDIQELFQKVKYIAAPNTFINEIKNWVSMKLIEKKNFYESRSNLDLIKWLKFIDNDVILISRGDPLWFGIGRILLENFSKEELLFYPNKTSLQLAFSKLKKSWQDVKAVSIHGRETNELIKSLKLKEKVIAILTDPKNNNLELIRQNLKELDLENSYELWLCEELGSKNEKIRLISHQKNLPKEISDLNIVILLKKELSSITENLPLFGISDNAFKTFTDRPNLLTKREIRIQLLADLELPEFGTLIDIGSGSGTIGLEALRLRPKLKLISIDKKFGSQLLIKENAKNLGVSPKKIIESDVKQFLTKDLTTLFSDSNRVVIGGCNKETKIEIIEEVSKFLKKGDIIVLPIITYEVLKKVSDCLRKLNYETNMNLIQTFKGLTIAEGTRFEPNNPVFIIKGKKK